MDKVHYSSKKHDWETPARLFQALNQEFKFTVDVCASEDNFKVIPFYSKEDDGLSKPWSGVCWMNPPYGREIGKWVKKAYEESQKGCTVVALLPSRTDTKYFHNYIYDKSGVEIRFLRGRLRFVNAPSSAPFPSMIVIWSPNV